jgi:hypothetical protein
VDQQLPSPLEEEKRAIVEDRFAALFLRIMADTAEERRRQRVEREEDVLRHDRLMMLLSGGLSVAGKTGKAGEETGTRSTDGKKVLKSEVVVAGTCKTGVKGRLTRLRTGEVKLVRTGKAREENGAWRTGEAKVVRTGSEKVWRTGEAKVVRTGVEKVLRTGGEKMCRTGGVRVLRAGGEKVWRTGEAKGVTKRGKKVWRTSEASVKVKSVAEVTGEETGARRTDVAKARKSELVARAGKMASKMKLRGRGLPWRPGDCAGAFTAGRRDHPWRPGDCALAAKRCGHPWRPGEGRDL